MNEIFNKYKELENRLLATFIHAGTAMAGGILYKLGKDENSLFFISALILFGLTYGFWYIADRLNYVSMEVDDNFDKWNASRKASEINESNVRNWDKLYKQNFMKICKFTNLFDRKAIICRNITFIIAVLGWIMNLIGLTITFTVGNQIFNIIFVIIIILIGFGLLILWFFNTNKKEKQLRLFYLKSKEAKQEDKGN